MLRDRVDHDLDVVRLLENLEHRAVVPEIGQCELLAFVAGHRGDPPLVQISDRVLAGIPQVQLQHIVLLNLTRCCFAQEL